MEGALANPGQSSLSLPSLYDATALTDNANSGQTYSTLKSTEAGRYLKINPPSTTEYAFHTTLGTVRNKQRSQGTLPGQFGSKAGLSKAFGR
jgi:hypothetical protein